jgi:hypothetical protein
LGSNFKEFDNSFDVVEFLGFVEFVAQLEKARPGLASMVDKGYLLALVIDE